MCSPRACFGTGRQYDQSGKETRTNTRQQSGARLNCQSVCSYMLSSRAGSEYISDSASHLVFLLSVYTTGEGLKFATQRLDTFSKAL